jgi:hypothetical protein
MHEIEMHEASTEFRRCWNAAGAHLSKQVQGGLNSWLRAHLDPPWLEHLSFLLGNQLFFVRIEDEAGRLRVPGSREGLIAVARGCAGHACLMTMRERLGSWRPTVPGWGLVDISTGRPVDPPALVTAEPVEMTDWELHDFAVQVVRQQLKSEGRQLMSWQSNPGVDPSIWFVGDHGPEWVVVRAARYAADPDVDDKASPPPNIGQIAHDSAGTGRVGHFAAVTVGCTDTMAGDGRLLRGHSLFPMFDGLLMVE